MTILPRRASAGTRPTFFSGMVRTTRSPASGGLLGGRRAGTGAEIVHQVLEGLGAATVAQDDVVPGVDGEPCDGAADVSASDESECGHGGLNGGPHGFIPPPSCGHVKSREGRLSPAAW